jgi:hypothetical protein
VAEAHELDARLLVLHALHEAGDVAAVALDALEHLEHGLVGAAVQRPEQRGDAAATDTNRLAWLEPTRRTVEVEQFCSWSACSRNSRFSALEATGLTSYCSPAPEGHAQEVVDVAQAVVGVEERLPDRLLVRVGRDGRHLGQQPHRRHLDVLGSNGSRLSW